MSRAKFHKGRLDHVHIRVPDREVAARWYAEHLGFEPVERFGFWATGFEGGPLQISADGGRTMLALFEASEGHPMVPQQTGVAFSLEAEDFIAFARSLPAGIDSPSGEPLKLGDVVDLDLCWAFNLADPWGNRYGRAIRGLSKRLSAPRVTQLQSARAAWGRRSSGARRQGRARTAPATSRAPNTAR